MERTGRGKEITDKSTRDNDGRRAGMEGERGEKDMEGCN